jgi:hypothetical protein
MDNKTVDIVFKIIGFTEPDCKLTDLDIELSDIGFDAFAGIELLDSYNILKVITETGTNQQYYKQNAGDIRDHSLYLGDSIDGKNELWYFQIPRAKIEKMSKLFNGASVNPLNRKNLTENKIWKIIHNETNSMQTTTKYSNVCDQLNNMEL